LSLVPLQQFATHTARCISRLDGSMLVTRDGVPAVAVTSVKDDSEVGQAPRTRGRKQKMVTMRELSRETHNVIREVERVHGYALVTSHGKIKAVIENIDPDAYAAWLVARTPELVESMRRADADLASGEAKSLDDFFDQLSD
jgi:predicted regulator of Ras-like GTPase activity (Roadblock/LC7/MglB family)